MKNLWILSLVIALGFTARATPLDDKMKNFTEALKASDASKPSANPVLAERMAAMPNELESSMRGQGGEANMEAMIRQIMASNPSPEVQETGKALLAELDARKKARVEDLTVKVNAVLTRAPEILIKAQKPPELDGILGDMQKVQWPQSGMYGNDQELQALINRVNLAYQFVAQWQDYLSARNSGNIQAAQTTLNNLLNSRPAGETELVPRSEILARVVALANQPKNSPLTPAPAVPTSVDVASILSGIKTLDDLEPAAKSLSALSASTNFSQQYTLSQLSQLAGLYANARDGLPIVLDFTPPNSTGTAVPEFGRVKAMLLLYLLPRFIGSDALTPNPNETVNDYLKRSIEIAEAKQNWPFLQRLVEAQSKASGTNTYSHGTLTFLAGLNQEMAGQYALAVTSYQSSLSSPDDFVPAKVVGDRLTAIKKEHPTEFDEGAKRFLNPPLPTYVNPYMMMPGMPVRNYITPGYPVPGTAPATNAAPVTPTPPPSPPTSTNAAPVSPAPPTK